MTFNKDCSKVFDKVITNPFSNAEFTKLNSSYIFPEVVVNDAGKVFTVGNDQYAHFCRTHFDIINIPIANNFLKLPKDTDGVQVENPRITINDF